MSEEAISAAVGELPEHLAKMDFGDASYDWRLAFFQRVLQEVARMAIEAKSREMEAGRSASESRP